MGYWMLVLAVLVLVFSVWLVMVSPKNTASWHWVTYPSHQYKLIDSEVIITQAEYSVNNTYLTVRCLLINSSNSEQIVTPSDHISVYSTQDEAYPTKEKTFILEPGHSKRVHIYFKAENQDIRNFRVYIS